MSFNSDRTKQAQEILFSRKKNATTHPPLFFIDFGTKLSSNRKHLGLTLDSKLSFNEHINDKIHQANKGVGLLRKVQTILPRSSLLTRYKSFIRPLLDYADVIYDQPSNASFAKKIESVQYNAALAITGAIKGSSREKLYQELGLEYLYRRRWARRLCLLYKIFQLVSHPIFMIFYHHWEVLVDMLIHFSWSLANLNISGTPPFLMSFTNGIN